MSRTVARLLEALQFYAEEWNRNELHGTYNPSEDLIKDEGEVARRAMREWETQDENSPVSVSDLIERIAAIREERNALYGENYRDFGKVMAGFFPGGAVFRTEEEWNRLSLFMHMAHKMSRYAANMPDGAHEDSMVDLSLYALIQASLDSEEKR